MIHFRKTLVIDDDPASRFLLEMVVEETGLSATVITLTNGKEALDYLQQHCLNQQAAAKECPDWILLDLNMPLMGGLEFLAHLRQLEQQHVLHTRVTVVTSSSYSKDLETARALCIKGYLLKPITEENLEELVKQW